MTRDSLADAKTALLKAVSNVPAAGRFTTVARNIRLKIGKGTGKPAVRRFLRSPPTRFGTAGRILAKRWDFDLSFELCGNVYYRLALDPEESSDHITPST